MSIVAFSTAQMVFSATFVPVPLHPSAQRKMFLGKEGYSVVASNVLQLLG